MNSVSALSSANLSPMLLTPANSARGAKAAREFETTLIASLLQSLETTFAGLPGEDESSGIGQLQLSWDARLCRRNRRAWRIRDCRNDFAASANVAMTFGNQPRHRASSAMSEARPLPFLHCIKDTDATRHFRCLSANYSL